MFGIHPFVWTDAWSYQSVPLIERAYRLGFDLLDIPVRTLNEQDVVATRSNLETLGMRAVAVAGVGAPYDLSADDHSVRQRTLEYLKMLVRNANGIGAEVLAGVYYGSIGKLVGRGPIDRELDRIAASLKELAIFAEDHRVKLALEPVSRYETYLLNTVEQGLAMVDRIGEANVGLLLDTYHMNIEEKDFYRAIVTAGDRLFHLHASENDRGIPGTGLVRWGCVFRALRDIDYEGGLSIESFVTTVPEIAASTCVWRTLAPDGDTLAREGLAFLRKMAKDYGLAK
jgi:D-psicose/D-tagatose/L-ribulose 3-epimerase